jgi:hypothetical protein
MTSKPNLAAVSTPDLAEVHARYRDLEDRHREVAFQAWIGALVMEFTNDELRAMADDFCIRDTLTLRKLGLLAPDEGFDGRKQPKRRRRTQIDSSPPPGTMDGTMGTQFPVP